MPVKVPPKQLTHGHKMIIKDLIDQPPHVSSQSPKTGRSSAIYSSPLSDRIISDSGVCPSPPAPAPAVGMVGVDPDGRIVPVPPGENPTGMPVVVRVEIAPSYGKEPVAAAPQRASQMLLSWRVV
jgi:hypothetical protein